MKVLVVMVSVLAAGNTPSSSDVICALRPAARNQVAVGVGALHGVVEPTLMCIFVSLVIGPAWQNTSLWSRMGHNVVQYYPPAVRTSIASHLFIIKAKHANFFVIANTVVRSVRSPNNIRGLLFFGRR
jgi:hypothetical protein